MADAIFSYSPVQNLDKPGVKEPECFPCSRLSVTILSLLGVLSSAIVVFLIISDNIIYSRTFLSNRPSQRCTEATIRREWRSLADTEKSMYLSAVQCLDSTPSKLRLNGSLHDDFIYLHSRIGITSHNAASFLPWHRYFIHIYEKPLQSQCKYTGTLPYWDWSLDWEDLGKAPVWSTLNGFGRDGNKTGQEVVANGRCVVDGLFTGLEVMYYMGQYQPHCLSRGFLNGTLVRRVGELAIHPMVLEEMLQEDIYLTFLLRLEKVAHLSIPFFVKGDFIKNTAPNDPVFFLHHAQVDRLWWIWQHKDYASRKYKYNGPSTNDAEVEAELTDVINFHGAAPKVTVQEIMIPETGWLCYRH